MIALLIAIVIILVCIILYQNNCQRQNSRNIQYIKNKLYQIVYEKTNEKLLLATDNKELRELLVEINSLLDHSQKVLADYRAKEISMKKMLSNISHDLKTPLTVVLGYIETLNLDKNIKQAEREVLLSKVHNKILEVIELMNKFFDLAKLESGDKEIEITRVNMNEICRKSILDFYDILDNRGFDVDISIPEANIYAMGNEEALLRVMNNLISNAIRYGIDGKVIGIRLSCDTELIYVEVWDKGKGIEEIHLDKVFERMYTMEDSRNKFFQGSGLGLTISKRLIEQMGGEILLKSKPNEKTSFIFKLKRITY
ncbi:MAG: sensor histidine kinase [Bacillota bacterium]|nr:sensor histidine kinase [Bacillota bacterium]